MKHLLACFVSAIAGGAVSLAMWTLLCDSGGRHTPYPAISPQVAKPKADGTAEPTLQLVQFPGPNRPLPANPAPPAAGMLRVNPELEMTPDERVAVRVYESANRSVVNITTMGVRQDNFFLLEVPTEGTGSGSILDKDGHVLTNYHVVEGAREVAVTIYNGETFEAEFVGADPVNDVAVLKIDVPEEDLFPVPLGDSNRLKVGMRVFALGNPFGLERTLTEGIVSSLNRSLKIRANRTVKSIIQIDAAINPGNSGGPLLNTRGQLVGMNTAIASKTGQSSGVGFAIPSSIISRVVPELIRFGRVKRPDVGIAKVYETERGLLIAKLVPDGPAEKAGLRGPRMSRRGPFVYIDRSAADLIVSVDNQPVKNADEFLEYIESKKPGQQVLLGVIRDGRLQQFPIRLQDDTGF